VRTLFAPVTVYSKPNCPPCKKVKDILDKAGIAYDDVDVTTNDEAYSYVTGALKANAVPVIVTDTHDPIIGLKLDRLQELVDYYTASETGV